MALFFVRLLHSYHQPTAQQQNDYQNLQFTAILFRKLQSTLSYFGYTYCIIYSLVEGIFISLYKQDTYSPLLHLLYLKSPTVHSDMNHTLSQSTAEL